MGKDRQVKQRRKNKKCRDMDSFEVVVLFAPPKRRRLIKRERRLAQIALDFPKDCSKLSSPLT
jgi:hypothetical protein